PYPPLLRPHAFPTRRSSDLLLGTWLRHHLLYTRRGTRRQAPQALAPPTGSGPRLSLPLTRLCAMRFPFVLVAAVSAAGFAGCARDRKSTRLNSSHGSISYAV